VGGLPGEDDGARQVGRVLGGVVDQVLELIEASMGKAARVSTPACPGNPRKC
jgi:hypothetical protein